MCGEIFYSSEWSSTSHLPSTTMQRMQLPACKSCVLVIQIQLNTFFLSWEALVCENDTKCVAKFFIQVSGLQPATFRRQRCNECNCLHVNHAFSSSRFNSTRFSSSGRHVCAKMTRNVWRNFHSIECSSTSHLQSTTMQRMHLPACKSCVLVIQIQLNAFF